MIHVNVWQKPLQYCKVISLQLIKEGKMKKKKERKKLQMHHNYNLQWEMSTSGRKLK